MNLLKLTDYASGANIRINSACLVSYYQDNAHELTRGRLSKSLSSVYVQSMPVAFAVKETVAEIDAQIEAMNPKLPDTGPR
jgi:hypothetical protein